PAMRCGAHRRRWCTWATRPATWRPRAARARAAWWRATAISRTARRPRPGAPVRSSTRRSSARTGWRTTADVSSEAFCREAGAPAGSDTHYALLFHRRADHRALCALLALRREILDIAEGSADPGVRGMRRSWWQEEILRAAGGTARHPV